MYLMARFAANVAIGSLTATWMATLGQWVMCWILAVATAVNFVISLIVAYYEGRDAGLRDMRSLTDRCA